MNPSSVDDSREPAGTEDNLKSFVGEAAEVSPPTTNSNPSSGPDLDACAVLPKAGAQGYPTAAEILDMLHTLPSEPPGRGAVRENSHIWTSGVWSVGNRVGLFEHTRSHGEFTALLCRYVHAMMPGFAFAAVACFSNLASEHVDVNHAPGSRILIAPLSSFKGGQVKIHVQPPQFLQVADGPCLLDPSLPHSTCPWQGDRVVLVAHMPKNVRLLSLPDLDVLKGLGFGLGALTHLLPASPSLPALAESPGPKPKKLWPPPGPLLPQAAAYPVVLELFAGTARVSACLRSFGVAAFGVDRDTSKAKAKCMEADLATAEGRELVLFWLRNPRLAGIFAAPMCGTCSRARQLSNGPPPLRSESCAGGLPNLSAHDQARVGEANAAYRCLTECLLQALDRSLLIIVENPLRSIFWLCSAWKPLAGRLHFAWCHACAYGSTRPKKTAFASNTPLIHAITRYCAGPSCEKNHEPWARMRLHPRASPLPRRQPILP